MPEPLGGFTTVRKIVKKHRLQDRAARQDDLDYWLSRPCDERVATVDYLRAQYYGNATSESCSRCSTPTALST